MYDLWVFRPYMNYGGRALMCDNITTVKPVLCMDFVFDGIYTLWLTDSRMYKFNDYVKDHQL